MIENEKALACIKENYIVDTDMDIIQKWASDKNVTLVSFRSAGKDTIEKLQKGAGAKPHSILEKTIKSEERLSEQFYGLVAHRNENTDTIGLYLTEYGYKLLSTIDKYMGSITDLKSGSNTLKILKLEDILDSLREDLSNDTGIQNTPLRANYKCFYTGDYDGHDLIQARSPVASELDTKLFADLQNALFVSWKKRFDPDNKLSGINSKDYQRVQHGVQYNYIAQMLDENRLANNVNDLNVIVDKVADYSTPLVVLVKTSEYFKWMIAESFEDLLGLYNTFGLEIKNTWTDPSRRKSFLIMSEKILEKYRSTISEDDAKSLEKKIQLQKDELDKLIKRLGQ